MFSSWKELSISLGLFFSLVCGLWVILGEVLAMSMHLMMKWRDFFSRGIEVGVSFL